MPDVSTSREPIRFNVFEVDLRSGEVRKDGVKVKLQEQPFQILQLLLEHPGDVVTRDELQRRIWPADTFVDFNQGLYNAIKRLREALGDTAETPRFIETLPKRGYRFIGTVNENGDHSGAPVGQAAVQGPQESSSIAESARISHKWRRIVVSLLAATAAVVVILAVAPGRVAANVRRWFSPGPSVPAIHSLAVLPLQNLSGDPNQEYFADGMTEELITELSRISGLRVISRTSVMRYKKTDKSLPEIARELNVDAIVEGSVLRSEDRVRITAQLIYAPKDTNLWAEAYDRDLRDVLNLQANVASDVAQQIHSQVTSHETAGRSRPRPVNLAALDAYLKGEYHTQRFGSGGDPEERYRAAEYFRQATRIDPGFARAWVELAVAYITNVSPSQKEAPIVKDALEKALAADPGLSDAHSWMARFKECHDWDFAAAEQEFRRAIELDPNSTLAHDYYGDYLNNMGRWREAEREEQLAQALDPNNDHLSIGLYNRGDYDRALELARNQVELHPEVGANHWNLSNVYFALGRYPEGIAEVQTTFRQYGYPEAASALAKTYAANGYQAALRRYAKELATVQGNPACPTMVANVYRILGDKDEAFKWLERGFVERDGFLVGLNVAEFDSIRGDPRFDDLVRRVGLPKTDVVPLSKR